jgi:hypothetical protein
MSNTPRDRQQEPMAREVDRLLAQLAHVGSSSAREQEPRGQEPRGSAPSFQPLARSRSTGARPSAAPGSRGPLIALWALTLLGIGLGGSMTQWPYSHECDLPLLGYLGAVVVVLLTGAWIAFDSWKLHSGMVHILSLILFFWGIVLAAEQLLPRLGYAEDRAAWRCTAESPPAVYSG